MNKQIITRCVLERTQEFISDINEINDHPPNEEDVFSCLGISSIDRAIIIAEVLEFLSLDIPMDNLVNASSVGSLADRIYSESLETAGHCANH